MKTAIELIADERIRQVEVEGWTAEHDDSVNINGQLANAAASYAVDDDFRQDGIIPTPFWPWLRKWWKPTPDDRIRELVKAGALIVAEIERLQRINLTTK